MSASREVFAKYPNRVFIETGTYKGEGIEMALEAGFKFVCSIELSDELFKEAIKKFADSDNVLILRGDSAVGIGRILDITDEPVTFWLDAHWSGGETARGEEISPLMRELDIIGEHNVKTHTIMMDDIRDWKTIYKFSIDDVKSKILSINPDYNFSIEDGFVPNDILVAWIKY